MLYLVGCIACNAATAVLIKQTQRKGWPGRSYLVINYTVAALICLVRALYTHSDRALGTFSVSAALDELPGVFSGASGQQAALLITIILGVVLGFLNPCAYMLKQSNTLRSGTGMTMMYDNMGFLVPLIMAIFLWGELPTLVKWIGIAGVLTAIVLSSTAHGALRINGGLLSLLLIAGLHNLVNKFYAVYGSPEYVQLYYAVVYITSMVVCALVVLVTERTLFPYKLCFGIVLAGIIQGTLNAIWGVLLQGALSSLPANVVYPTQGAGGMALIAIISLTVFREKLHRNQIIAMAISIVCLVLVNI